MMTDNEIMQTVIGMALWQFTWELFLGQYFYTRSEKEIMTESRGKGRFTWPTLMSIFIAITVYAIIFFKMVKYLY